MDVNVDLTAGRHVLLSQRLRFRRRDLGLTQKQVVTRLIRLGVNTSNKALSGLEHGAGLDIAKLPELAEALECSITYLLGLTDDPHRWEPDKRRPSPAPGPAATADRPPRPKGAADRDRPQPPILGPLDG